MQVKGVNRTALAPTEEPLKEVNGGIPHGKVVGVEKLGVGTQHFPRR